MTNTPQHKGYSPRETANVKAEALSKIIEAQHSLTRKAEIPTDLSNVEAVKQIVSEYFANCQTAAMVPSFEGISAACGVSRKTAYQYLRNHPESETAKFLEVIQTELAAIRTAAADKGCINETFAIFQLLNSNQGYTNKHDIEVSQPQPNPLEISPEDVEAVRTKYINALPDDD